MKLHKTNCFLTVFTVVFILTGCKKTVYNSLSEEDVKWLVYNQYDTIIFATSSAIADTYVVVNRTKGYTIDKPYYNEVASIIFSKQNDTIGGIGFGNIKTVKNNDNQLSVSFDFPHFSKFTLLTYMTPVPLDTINGLPYMNVYISEADSLSITAENYIRKVYYTQQDGFIKLEDMYGNLWYKIN